MIGMHLHDGTYMVGIEDPVTGRGELLRLLGTGGDPPKGKLATWSPSFEDSARKGAFARMEGMRERVEIMIEEAFNKKEWIKMGLPQKKRKQEDEVLGVMVAEKESEVELGANLPKQKEVRMDVPEVALEIPDLLQLIKALRYQKGYCLNGKLVSIQLRVVEATRAIPTVHFLRERSRKEVFESISRLDDDPRMTTEELIEARCRQVLKNEEVMEDIVHRVLDSRMRDKASGIRLWAEAVTAGSDLRAAAVAEFPASLLITAAAEFAPAAVPEGFSITLKEATKVDTVRGARLVSIAALEPRGRGRGGTVGGGNARGSAAIATWSAEDPRRLTSIEHFGEKRGMRRTRGKARRDDPLGTTRDRTRALEGNGWGTATVRRAAIELDDGQRDEPRGKHRKRGSVLAEAIGIFGATFFWRQDLQHGKGGIRGEAHDEDRTGAGAERYMRFHSEKTLELLPGAEHTHVLTLDSHITSNCRLRAIIKAGLNHIPLRAFDVDEALFELNGLLDRLIMALYDIASMGEHQRRRLRQIVLDRAKCKMDGYICRHRFITAEPIDQKSTRREIDFLTERFLVSPTDKSANTPSFVCTNFIRTLALRRLLGPDFVMQQEDPQQIISTIKASLTHLPVLPIAHDVLPYLMSVYKAHKQSFRWITNTANTVMSPMADLCACLLRFLTPSVQSFCAEKSRTLEVEYGVKPNLWWPITSVGEFAANLPQSTYTVYTVDITRCFETIPTDGSQHSLMLAVKFFVHLALIYRRDRSPRDVIKVRITARGRMIPSWIEARLENSAEELFFSEDEVNDVSRSCLDHSLIQMLGGRYDYQPSRVNRELVHVD
ncbi:hypothetical protein CBR_g44593 [Chara braunii]|uniref:Reverse transcriptase domain-containing protein n=1 Tax=Chara braunii TaxID=69332 RepID=A0A388LXV0_CHABU|nr:hypothetical protein CBR_g44593 [Chara braunii]|eukprot:GBG87136.1 hypothetical protein CBR_g44593 [Chara braunii]